MSAALKLNKGTFKHVENELSRYHETRKEMMRLRNEIMYTRPSDDENVGGGRSSLPGDPTGRTATALATNRRLQHMEIIVDAIEDVYNRLPPEKQLLVSVVYWTKPQMLSWDGIAQKLNVSRKTAFRWRDEIIWAVGEGLGWR